MFLEIPLRPAGPGERAGSSTRRVSLKTDLARGGRLVVSCLFSGRDLGQMCLLKLKALGFRVGGLHPGGGDGERAPDRLESGSWVEARASAKVLR